MKRIMSFLVLCICLCFSGCGTIYKLESAFNEIQEDNDYIDSTSEEIVRCFDEQDVESLKKLFSLEARCASDFDSQIENAFSLYKGKSESYYVTDKSSAGSYVDGVCDDKHFTPKIREIVTNEGNTYYITYLIYSVYESDNSRVGIVALGLLDENQVELARICREQ